MSEFDGIEGLKGREPVGAALTIGIKDRAKGFPIEKDRFHLVQPREADGRRAYLPVFEAFNTAAPDLRRFIQGNLVHTSRIECFEHYLKNQVGPQRKSHPNKRPFCIGDGTHAMRWMGGDPDDFRQITCPHDKCEFRQGKPVPCKPWMRFLFRLRWKEGSKWPTPLTKFTSGSWFTVSNFLGFFDYVDRAAAGVGLQSYSLMGFPFTLQLTEQTKASEKTRFPVVTISPEADPIEWFQWQQQQMAALTAGQAAVALPEPPEQDDLIIAGDYETISVPSE